MTPALQEDWSPDSYARFRDLRLRPAIDLLARVPAIPRGDIVDLGCGAGAAGAALRARFGQLPIGVDSSPAMLAKAAETGVYARLIETDAATWLPDRPPAVIFSNAVLHWLSDHAGLITRLADALAPGGCLAVQMPRQYAAPSHALLRETAAQLFPDRFDFSRWVPPVAAPGTYVSLLASLGTADVWETVYQQRLMPKDGHHPVHAFTASTAMRPFLERLDDRESVAFRAAYDAALASAYPRDADGSAVLPFRRLFFVLQRAT